MRSITGEGNRQTLIAAKELIPKLEIIEVPTGTKIWDWTVPKEWIFRGAKVTNNKGEVILDSEIHNPHWPGETIALIEILGIRNVEIRNFPFNPNTSYIVL